MLARAVRDNPGLYLASGAASFVFSLVCVYLGHVINNDAVEYLRAASVLGDDGLRAAFSVYKWPFYPALIALASTVSGTTLLTAAHIVNAGLWMLVVWAFMVAARELGADRRVLLVAAAVILLYPGINVWRAQLIRDPGYLAFYLFSLAYLVRLYRVGTPAAALGWLGATVIATLFRVEGAVFLIAVPVWFAAVKLTGRRRLVVLVVALPLAGTLLTAFAWWLISPGAAVEATRLTVDPTAIFANAWSQVTAELGEKLYVLREEFLGRFSREYAVVVMALVLLAIVTLETFWTLTPLYFLVCAYAVHRGAFPPATAKAPWWFLIATNIGILLTFSLIKLFLTARYPIALTLTVLLAAPFGLVHWYDRWRARRGAGTLGRWRAVGLPAFVVLVVLVGLESLDRTTPHGHLKAAGRWIGANAPAGSLVTNDKRIPYYAQGPKWKASMRPTWVGVMDTIRSGEISGFDVIALRVRRGERYRIPRLVRMLGRQPVEVFDNGREDRVLIFRLRG